MKDSMRFKEYFQEKMQRQINELPSVFSDGQEPEIACVYFAYNNAKLISALKKRGDSLTNGKISKLLKDEDYINKLCEDHSDDFKRPV